jgi:hypothetical protein
MKHSTRLALLCVLTHIVGCLDNRPIVVGGTAGAGSPTGAAGGGGAPSGSAGAAGTGGVGGNIGALVPPGVYGCDVTPLFIGPNSRYKCSETAICHDALGGGANLSMSGNYWMSHLVGIVPKGGGVVPSICATDPMFKNMPYIIEGDPNGDGLFIRKLSAAPGTEVCHPGGVPMPLTGNPLSAADLACVKVWATALASLPAGGLTPDARN